MLRSIRAEIPSGPGAMLVGELRMRSSTLSGEHKREGGVEIGGGGEDGEERGGEEELKQEEKYELRTFALEVGVQARTSLKDREGMEECDLRSFFILGQKDLGLEVRDLKKQDLSFLRYETTLLRRER